MNIANLALQQTPPLSVPLRFFLTAPLFGLLTCLLLFAFGPAVITNRWSFITLAAVHLLTLGVITMVMTGALLQLIPVLAGVRILYPRWTSSILHGFLTVGSLSLTGGFALGYPQWLLWGGGLLMAYFILFSTVMAYCLIKAVTTPIVIAMRFAVVGLSITVGLGAWLVFVFSHGNAISSSFILTNLHLAWGLIGWVGLLLVGIAYQIVPMFQITPHYPPVIQRWLIISLFTTLLLWSLAYWLAYLGYFSVRVPTLFMSVLSGEFVLFATTTLYLQKQRLRKVRDVSLNYWRSGMVALLVVIVLWLMGQILPTVAKQPTYPLLLGIVFIMGFVLSIIQGTLYKIVAFLIWLHLQNRQLNVLQPIQLKPLPSMKQIILDKYAYYQFWVYLVALLILIIAIFWHPLIYLGTAVLAIAFLLLSYNLYRALWVYYVSEQ